MGRRLETGAFFHPDTFHVLGQGGIEYRQNQEQ
jgi:hypothetical protein